MNSFTKNQPVWVLIDGERIKAIYDVDNGDGFHYVKITEHKASMIATGELYRATSSEITERYI